MLLASLPAIIIAVTVIVVTILSLSISEQDLQIRYLERANQAKKNKNTKMVLTCYERLVATENAQPDALYGLAVAAEELSQHERALAVMRKLAPKDDLGYSKAHYWMARKILRMRRQTETSLLIAKNHLTKALEGELSELKPHAQFAIAQIHFYEYRKLIQEARQLEKAGNKALSEEKYRAADLSYNEAKSHYNDVVERIPVARLELAQLHIYNNENPEEAKFQAQRVQSIFQIRTKTDPLKLSNRLVWAEATFFLKDYEQAISILETGRTLAPPEMKAGLSKLIAQKYGLWSKHIRARKPEESLSKCLEMWEKGLEYDPTNQYLLNQLLSEIQIGGPRAAKIRPLLQTLLVKTKGLGFVHFALGVDAWERGDKKNAITHWELAYEDNPNLSVVANNLAWILSNPGPITPSFVTGCVGLPAIHSVSPIQLTCFYKSQLGDLERAFTIINSVIEKLPDEKKFLHTRGHIFMKFGLWKKALRDFENLPDQYQEEDFHRSSAIIWENLGNQEMAQLHRQMMKPKSDN